MTKKLLLCALCAVSVLSGCASIGTHRLRADQVDYGNALGDANKRAILSAIVGLRFADNPSFLTVTQIIAAYSFDAGGSALLNAGPGTDSYARGNVGGTVSYSDHPTFTFTPTTGDAYATQFIRPLPATLILPLSESGIPIDLLLRLTAQSIGGYQNASSLGGPNSNGSPEFFQLLHVLRNLQVAGELTTAYEEVDHVGRVTMTFSATPSGESGQTNADLITVRKLLHLSPTTKTYQVVYGQSVTDGKTIPMVTESVLGILGNLGAQIEVPPSAVEGGETKPTIALVGGETRPTIIVHNSPDSPSEAYVAIKYRGRSYWISQFDFDSKYAITIVQNLMALAESNTHTNAPIVTVPAG